MNPNQYLSVEGAAQLIGLSVSTLNKWRVSGRGPRFSKLGRRVIYAQAELEQWVADHLCASTSAYTA